MADQFVKLPVDLLRRSDLSLGAKVVYAIIVDRIGANKDAWPGMRRIGAACCLSVGCVHEAIGQLESAGLIVADRVKGNPGGKTNRYRLVERSAGERSLFERSVDVTVNVQQVNDERSAGEHIQTNTQTQLTRPNNTSRASTRTSTSELIYQAYPKHIGKAAALKSIEKALKAIDARNGVPDAAAWLLERTQAFKASPAGNAGQFTPHPATWFNQARYDDDPREWSRNDGSRTTRLPITSDLPDYDANAIRAVPHAVASQR